MPSPPTVKIAQEPTHPSVFPPNAPDIQSLTIFALNFAHLLTTMTPPQPHADLASPSHNPTAYPSALTTTSMAAHSQTQHILLIASCVQVNLDDIALHARNQYALAARPARLLLIINLDVGIAYAILQIALFVLGRVHVASVIRGTSTVLLRYFAR